MKIPFNRPFITGREAETFEKALKSGKHCGNGPYSKQCEELLKKEFGLGRVFLTPSATAALEMSTVLAGIEPGDEVILPSYTFSSTANAYCLRGAKPVFVDIEMDTFVMDISKIEEKITRKTKAIVPINYGGVSPDLDALLKIADEQKLVVIEDAAQGIDAKYKGRFVGSMTPMSVFSFHETKNISCGEGGALIVNDQSLERLGEFAQEKGTDRSLVIAGLKSKYSWVSLGSSYLLSDFLSAVLLPQLEARNEICIQRKRVFDAYEAVFAPLRARGVIRTQKIPETVESNYHGYYLLFSEGSERDRFIAKMGAEGIACYIGYLALHTSEMGRRFGGSAGTLPVTEQVEKTIVRLPIYAGLSEAEINYICERMEKYFNHV